MSPEELETPTVYGEHGSMLFHYTTADVAFGRILKSGQLRFSAYRIMNDPLEAKYWQVRVHLPMVATGTEVLRKLMYEGEIALMAAEARSATKMLSMAQDSPAGDSALDTFARGYARASLWQLYGDRHCGVCLAFDKERLTSMIEAQLLNYGRPCHGPVEYRNGGYVVDEAALNLVTQLEPGQDRVMHARRAVAAHLDTHHRTALFTKVTDWSNEHEYRYVVVDRRGEQGDYIHCDYGDSIRAVFLGQRFPKWQRDSARVTARAVGADLCRVRWDFGWPSVTIEPGCS